MANIAQNSFLIKKLIDGKTLSFSLSSTSPSTQIESKDPISYNPNYAVDNLEITPMLTVSGQGGANQIKSVCKWFINSEELQGTAGAANLVKWGATVGATAPYSLKIAKNMTAVSQMVIRCEYTYVDPVTTASTGLVTDKTITKAENSGKSIIASVYAPKGDKFTVNGGVVQPLSVKASLIRGGDTDISDVTYKWSVSIGGSYYVITAATAPAGSGLPSGTLFAGWAGTEMTVYSTAVLNVATFKCEITDTDPASTTKGLTATGYVTLYDATDPYEIIVRQPQGDSITNSSSAGCVFEIMLGRTSLPDTFYNGKTFKFYRNTAAGAADATWAPSPAFTGWTVAAGIVSRAYASGQGTVANRTITIVDSHLLANAPVTVFGITLEG